MWSMDQLFSITWKPRSISGAEVSQAHSRPTESESAIWQNLQVICICGEAGRAPCYTTLASFCHYSLFPENKTIYCGHTMHRRLTGMWVTGLNGAYWVENLRPVSRGPWALCIDWSAPLTGYNVSAATPSLLPCIRSEVMKSQQMLGRFCLNISMCGHPRPSEEKEPVIFPLRKKNTQICL